MNYTVVKKREGQKDTDTRQVGDMSDVPCSCPGVLQWVSADVGQRHRSSVIDPYTQEINYVNIGPHDSTGSAQPQV